MEVRSFFEQHTYSGFEQSQAFDVVYGGHFEHRLLSPQRATFGHRRLVLDDVRLETCCYDFPVIAQGAMPVSEGFRRTAEPDPEPGVRSA